MTYLFASATEVALVAPATEVAPKGPAARSSPYGDEGIALRRDFNRRPAGLLSVASPWLFTLDIDQLLCYALLTATCTEPSSQPLGNGIVLVQPASIQIHLMVRGWSPRQDAWAAKERLMDATLAAYLPQDRRLALAHSVDLPERTSGTALFADISGFTPLTEALDHALGHRRGIEELTRQLNQVYTALIAEVERYDGSVIDFAGDSITCWFDELQITDCRLQIEEASDESSAPNLQPPTSSLRATACALALQQAMRQFAAIALPDGTITALALKVAVASGPARRFAVGDPQVQRFDILAGAPLTRAAAGEHLARAGEVLTDEATAVALGEAIMIAEWRMDQATGQRFAVIAGLQIDVEIADTQSAICNLQSAMLHSWLLPAIYARHQAGLGDFLTELRPAVPLFLRFTGIDFANDPAASAKLDALIRVIQEQSARYDGTLLQITIGDKGSYLYLVFGVPTAHEDDPRRAVACALELRAALAARAEPDGHQPRCDACGGLRRANPPDLRRAGRRCEPGRAPDEPGHAGRNLGQWACPGRSWQYIRAGAACAYPPEGQGRAAAGFRCCCAAPAARHPPGGADLQLAGGWACS